MGVKKFPLVSRLYPKTVDVGLNIEEYSGVEI
jgi:hypothetical protein